MGSSLPTVRCVPGSWTLFRSCLPARRHGRTFLAAPAFPRRPPPCPAAHLPALHLQSPPRRELETFAPRRAVATSFLQLSKLASQTLPPTTTTRKPALTMPAQAPTPRTTRNSRGLRSSPGVVPSSSARVSRRRSSGTASRTNFVCRPPRLALRRHDRVHQNKKGWLTMLSSPPRLPAPPPPTPPPQHLVRGSRNRRLSPPTLLPSRPSRRSSRRLRLPHQPLFPRPPGRRSTPRRSLSPRPPHTLAPRYRVHLRHSSTRGLKPSEAPRREGTARREPRSGIPGSSPDLST